MSVHAYSTEQIETMLAPRIEDLARRFSPAGRRVGHEWLAREAVPGSDCSSFLINLKTGKWGHFAAGKTSHKAHPCLSLIAYLATGDDFGKAILWAKDYLGLTGHAPDAARAAALSAQAMAARAKVELEDAEATERRRRAAHRIWLTGRPLDGHDPASQYLAARGIDVHALAHIPNALRYNPSVRINTITGAPHAAMVAAMHLEGAPDGFAAVHATYIKYSESQDKWLKAFGKDDSKKMLGPKAGAAIRLLRGASNLPLAKARAGEWAAIGEGIENCLSAALHNPGIRVLCCGTLENISKVKLPEHIAGIKLIADNDRPGSKAETQLEKVTNALAERGLTVEVYRAPPGFKDFNDALCGKEMVIA